MWAVHDHDHSAEEHSDEEGGHAGHDHGEHEGHAHQEHNHAHDHEGHDHAGHDHSEHDHGNHEPEKPLLEYPDKDITTLLLQFKSKTNIQALNMLRGINENTDLLAASPAIELNRLYDMMDVGEQTLRVLAIIIIFVSALSIVTGVSRVAWFSCYVAVGACFLPRLCCGRGSSGINVDKSWSCVDGNNDRFRKKNKKKT